MRILFFANYSLLYGANRSMLTLLRYLKKKGCEIKVMLPHHGEVEEELTASGIDYEVFRLFNQFLYVKFDRKYILLPLLILWDILVFPLILYKARRFRPDLIYSNTAAECVGVLVAKCLRIHHVWHIREFMDRDHKKYFLFGNKVRQWYINLSDGIVFVSRAVADGILHGKIREDKHKVVYNGLDLPDISISEKHVSGLKPDLGMVGLLCEGKGQLTVIKLLPDILKHYPNATLHIFGDRESSYKSHVVDVVKELDVTSHVVFHGFVKEQKDIYPNVDILLMCSESEGFGRVTVEAMTYGVPVIGYDNAGTSEIVKDGQNGFLYMKPNDIPVCMEKLLCSDERFNSFRLQAREYAQSEFSINRYCSEVYNFIARFTPPNG